MCQHCVMIYGITNVQILNTYLRVGDFYYPQ